MSAVEGHVKIDSVVANAGFLDPVQNVNEIDVNGWKNKFKSISSVMTLWLA
ncbi:hypothetical protein RNJ44_00848 [Nakaseomyces bracarensis]|uniref:Uncharacterized protein n=1 Tax=Nakaseomyces bracarensis TaxID=273131 RepID=A0ABR4NSD3_9SACH